MADNPLWELAHQWRGYRAALATENAGRRERGAPQGSWVVHPPTLIGFLDYLAQWDAGETEEGGTRWVFLGGESAEEQEKGLANDT